MYTAILKWRGDPAVLDDGLHPGPRHIAIDDGGYDSTGFAPPCHARTTVLRSPVALSHAAAWNLGASHARPGFLLFESTRRADIGWGGGGNAGRLAVWSGPTAVPWLLCDRDRFLAVGGFDEALTAPPDAVADLAARLHAAGAAVVPRPTDLPPDRFVRLGSLGVVSADPPSVPAPVTVAATRPFFSIVVPTYRRPAALAHLLARLAPAARRDGAEIVIVNDGSHDAAYAAAWTPHADVVRYRALDANAGRGAATREGITMAGGDWILFTDDDVWPPDDWLATLRSLLHDFPMLDAVGGTTRPIARDRPSLVERFTIRRPHFQPRPHFSAGTLKCLITACLAVRRSALEAAGGIDPAFPCGQDHNLTWRLRRIGARIHVTERWWCGHDQGWSLSDLLGRLREYGYWHVRQSELSGDPVDYRANPASSWPGLLRQLRAELGWVARGDGYRGLSLRRRIAFRGLDLATCIAWNRGGIAAARDRRKRWG